MSKPQRTPEQELIAAARRGQVAPLKKLLKKGGVKINAQDDEKNLKLWSDGILHGTGDKTVDYHQSELFAEVLEKAGTPHQLILVPDAPHTFHLQPKQRDLRPLVLGFFDQHLKPHTDGK